MLIKILLAATALALVPTPASAVELIVNGGFENPTVANPCCTTVPPAPLPGWTVSPNVNVVNGTFSSTAGNLAEEGAQYLDLVGEGGTGAISQTFATVAGQVYTLSFIFSHNLFSGTPSASASFSVDGLVGSVFHNSGSTSDLDWLIFSGNFLADNSSATLNFTNLTGGINEGVLLDAISVQAAVPEPATWAMMLLGFGAIGGAMRASRRKQRGVAFA